MDKREACHRLADMNEAISELEDQLRSIEKNLRWHDENYDWYLSRKADVSARLSEYKEEHDEFIRLYSNIIYS